MAEERVRPLKIESIDRGGGEEDEFPTSLDPQEDVVDAHGLAIQNSTSDDEDVMITRDASNNMVFQDGVVSGSKTLTQLLAGGAGLDENAHRQLDQLAHMLDENYYEEYTYSGNKVTNVTAWTDSGKILKVRESQMSYTGNRLTGITEIQYDASGTETERLTSSVIYSGNKIQNITVVRT
jgi:hypothetical protein